MIDEILANWNPGNSSKQKMVEQFCFQKLLEIILKVILRPCVGNLDEK